VPPTHEQKLLTAIAASIYDRHPFDGKYIIGRYRRRDGKHFIEPSEDDDRSLGLTICQSNATNDEILDWWHKFGNEHLWDLQEKFTFCFGRDVENRKRYISLTKVNPLGEWTGGPNTDCGATNRKLGSDMGDGVTGGGLHGKDLSKADVSVNIWCYLESIRTGHQVEACCSIGDETVNGIPYADIVEQARNYIHNLGGFEKFAEWGLIRPDRAE
jgi:S-adenosylmethionine synthetase